MDGAVSLTKKIFEKIIFSFVSYAIKYFREQLPLNRLLGAIKANKERCVIFLRDHYLVNGTVVEMDTHWRGGIVPNVVQFWADVDAKAIADVFYVLGKAGKNDNIEIVEWSKDRGIWNTNMFCIGAQFPKAFAVYEKCENIYYKMDTDNIIRKKDGLKVKREDGYGYGLILKGKNPFVNNGQGVVFLIGGYGVLGTEAAGYYFRTQAVELGKAFKSKCFARVVRASISLGYQSVECLPEFDIVEK